MELLNKYIPGFIAKEISRLATTTKIFKETISNDTRDEVCDMMFKYIFEHPTLQWGWKEISCNPNVTEKFITKHIDYPWEYATI